jgi:hypothetical protein
MLQTQKQNIIVKNGERAVFQATWGILPHLQIYSDAPAGELDFSHSFQNDVDYTLPISSTNKYDVVTVYDIGEAKLYKTTMPVARKVTCVRLNVDFTSNFTVVNNTGADISVDLLAETTA